MRKFDLFFKIWENSILLTTYFLRYEKIQFLQRNGKILFLQINEKIRFLIKLKHFDFVKEIINYNYQNS